jgi:hypothetical protein
VPSYGPVVDEESAAVPATHGVDLLNPLYLIYEGASTSSEEQALLPVKAPLLRE